MTAPKPTTVKGVMDAATAYLTERRIGQTPRQVCELLMARLLHCKRLDLYLRFDTVLSEKILEAMRRGVRRVAAGEPVQYVLGETEFMGHRFKTDSRALIPRPETELLVETVAAWASLWNGERPTIVDVGTGSGCILLSLALARPEADYLGIDRSADAIALATHNASALGIAEQVRLAVTAELADEVEPQSVDAVVANLPYVPTEEYLALPPHIREFEPRDALDGGPDGLSVIEAVVPDVGLALKPGGAIFLEIAEDQAEAVTELLEAEGFTGITVKRDLADRDRIVVGTLEA